MAETVSLREESHLASPQCEDGDDYAAEMYKKVNEISNLVTIARLQAQEADIRARYAAQYAERAISEAKCAHEVSASLARTSRTVASLAMDFLNDTDMSALNWSTESNMSELSNYSLQAGDFSYDAKNFDSEIPSHERVQDEPRVNSTPGGIGNDPIVEKYQASYPDDISSDSMKPFTTQLQTVLEENGRLSQPSTPFRAELEEEQKILRGKMKNLEIHRKMILYKDSKRWNEASIQSGTEAVDEAGEEEERVDPIYVESSTQTVL